MSEQNLPLVLGYKRVGDDVVFWIEEQKFRGPEFWPGGYMFIAASGFALRSVSEPEMRHVTEPEIYCSVLCVRGDITCYDRRMLTTSWDKFKTTVLPAVAEYNTQRMSLDVTAPDPVAPARFPGACYTDE